MCFFLQALFLRVESSVCNSGWSIGAGDYKGAMSSMHYPANINKGKKRLTATLLLFYFLSLQAISAKDRPYHNCFLYDGVRNTGIVEALSP